MNTQTYNLVHTIPAPSCAHKVIFVKIEKLTTCLRVYIPIPVILWKLQNTTATKGFCTAEQKMIEMIGTYK